MILCIQPPFLFPADSPVVSLVTNATTLDATVAAAAVITDNEVTVVRGEFMFGDPLAVSRVTRPDWRQIYFIRRQLYVVEKNAPIWSLWL